MADRSRRPPGAAGNVQMGDMSAVESMLYGNVEDDEELMNELLALQAEEEAEVIRSRPAVPVAPPQKAAGPASGVNFATIDRLARQISKEATIQDDENDASVETDADLLGELNELMEDDDHNTASANPPPPAGASSNWASDLIPVLQERLQSYQTVEANARRAKDGASAQRFGAAVQTLQSLLTNAQSGYPIDLDAIPDPAPTYTPPPPPRPSTSTPANVVASPTSPSAARSTVVAPTEQKASPQAIPASGGGGDRQMLLQRRIEYKTAAMHAKNGGDKAEAVRCYKVAKQLDALIAAVDGGESVDLSSIPPSLTSRQPQARTEQTLATGASPEKTAPPPPPAASAPPKPKTAMEALEQRLQKYRDTAANAKQQGDDRRMRQSERIAKQYQDAIRAHKAGRPVNFDDLPVPPGFPPIPAVKPAALPSPVAESAPVASGGDQQGQQQRRMGEKSPLNASAADDMAGGAAPVKQATPPKLGRQQQQLQFLKHRQAQFKEVALVAKRRGDIAMAKKFLTQAKGFDQMIEASMNGVRVDISNIPSPPQMKTSAAALQPTVNPVGAGTVAIQGSREEVLSTLEQDLIRQVQICERNQEYFTRLGDVSQVNRFEKMATMCKKDLVALRQASKVGDPVPRFRYETRSFPTLESCPDLAEDDLEVGVVRALQLRLPDGYQEKDADLFVRWELAFPPERPQTGKTHSIDGTASPTFGERMRLKINRKSRAFQRFVKRQGVKFEVYQKGSLFRSDKLIGTCEVKMLALETQCQIHEAMDLLDGRRAAGGKLEVKVRIREPLTEHKPTETKEKWLVIDEFLVHPRRLQQQKAAAAKPKPIVASHKPRLPTIPIGDVASGSDGGARLMDRRAQQPQRKLSGGGGTAELNPAYREEARRRSSPQPPPLPQRGLRRIEF